MSLLFRNYRLTVSGPSLCRFRTRRRARRSVRCSSPCKEADFTKLASLLINFYLSKFAERIRPHLKKAKLAVADSFRSLEGSAAPLNCSHASISPHLTPTAFHTRSRTTRATSSALRGRPPPSYTSARTCSRAIRRMLKRTPSTRACRPRAGTPSSERRASTFSRAAFAMACGIGPLGRAGPRALGSIG